MHPSELAELLPDLNAEPAFCTECMEKQFDDLASGGEKRKRMSVFDEICQHKLHTVTALRAHAMEEAKAGRSALAEYCTRQDAKLEDVLQGAWAVLGAAAELVAESKSLMDKLVDASVNLPCECGGRWAPGAAEHLRRNGIPVGAFCGAVLQALRIGAGRGSNVALIGEGGCGKSTLLEPLEKIFSCAPKPEEGSTFPLASLLGYDIMLWQDYEHDEKSVRFTDLLSWFMREGVGARRPGVVNKKVKNTAPCFYSGRSRMELLPSKKHPVHVCQKYNGMMDERFCTFEFKIPMLKHEHQINFPMCGHCAAKFYLQGVSYGAPMGPRATTSLASELEKLAQMHSAGVLDADEFRSAKRQLLQS